MKVANLKKSYTPKKSPNTSAALLADPCNYVKVHGSHAVKLNALCARAGIFATVCKSCIEIDGEHYFIHMDDNATARLFVFGDCGSLRRVGTARVLSGFSSPFFAAFKRGVTYFYDGGQFCIPR